VGTAGTKRAVSVGATSGVDVAVGVADAITFADTVAVDVGTVGAGVVDVGSGESVGVSSSDTVVVGPGVVDSEGVGEGGNERGVLVDVGAVVSVGDGGASVAGGGASVGAGGSSVVGSGTGVRVGTVCRC
jgi:hypothetical protein